MGISWKLLGERRVREALVQISLPSLFPYSCPKINVFKWVLVHNQILTMDNLKRRGIEAPLRCILYKSFGESAKHLFLDYEFLQNVRSIVLRELNSNLPLPLQFKDFFSKWHELYPGSLSKKRTISKIWNVLPKNISWQVWLAPTRKYLKERRQILAGQLFASNIL